MRHPSKRLLRSQAKDCFSTDRAGKVFRYLGELFYVVGIGYGAEGVEEIKARHDPGARLPPKASCCAVRCTCLVAYRIGESADFSALGLSEQGAESFNGIFTRDGLKRDDLDLRHCFRPLLETETIPQIRGGVSLRAEI
jgi:hypothetical protein